MGRTMASFHGFQQRDFSTDVRGTHWRNRQALGRELRVRLRRIFGRRYQTWGWPGSNTMHIARRAAYQFAAARPQAALFVMASTDFLRWGLALPLSGSHWLNFRASLQHGAAMPILLQVMQAHRLTFTDVSDPTGGALGGCWRFERGELVWREACSLPRPAVPHDILYRLDDLPADERRSLHLFCEVDAATALGWESKAAERLLPLLSALIPLYEICIDFVA